MSRIGAVIAGKYRVDRLIGHGGMGVVMAATHIELREQVALKFLHPTRADEPSAVERFLREARAVVRLRSEHVARVLDVGRLEDGMPFMVMELLEGEDLGAVIKKRGMTLEEAVEVILQACVGIAEAHAHGLVHRDIKPANLFLTRRTDGTTCVKVLDFGLVKLLGGDSGENATGANELLGSPSYMSPEQIGSAAEIDARADVWSLACVFFEALTGKRPFHAPTLPEVVARVMQGEPTPLRALMPQAPPRIEEVIREALVKDRSLRTSSVAAFAEALLPFAKKRDRLLVERINRILWHKSVPSLVPPEAEDESTSTLIDVPPRHVADALPGSPSPASRGPTIRPRAPREVVWLPTLTGGEEVPWVAGGDEPASTSSVGSDPRRSRRRGRATLRFAMVAGQVGSTLDELKEAAGAGWAFRLCNDYGTLLEVLDLDEVDLAWLPPVPYVRAAVAGLARLVLTCERKGLASYNAAIVVREDAAAKDLSYLKGRNCVWVDKWSAAGYLVPRQMLRVAGVDPDRDLGAQGFARSYRSVITALTSGAADAGALYCSLDQGELVQSAWMPSDGLRALAVSEPIPGDTICVPPSQTTEDSDIIVDRLLDLASSPRASRVFQRVLGTNRFVAGNPDRYASLIAAQAADALGRNRS
jgi:serine/threonine protein kinase/ABC-type phosphate/phosphonate transport system substrate-binding protein